MQIKHIIYYFIKNNKNNFPLVSITFIFMHLPRLIFVDGCCGRMFSGLAGSIADSLPALLLIHGDSYSWGAGNSFDGTALAAHGRLIVVSINFRLGVLGKLAILIHWNKLSQFSTISEHELRLANVCGYFIWSFAVVFITIVCEKTNESISERIVATSIDQKMRFSSYSSFIKIFNYNEIYIQCDFNLMSFVCNKSQD